MSVASVRRNGGKYLLVSILLIAGCAAKNQRVPEPTIIAVGTDHSVARQRLKARRVREVSSAMDMRYPKDTDAHAYELGPTSLMVLLVERESGTVRSISVCHSIDRAKAFREWIETKSYDLSRDPPNPRVAPTGPH